MPPSSFISPLLPIFPQRPPRALSNRQPVRAVQTFAALDDDFILPLSDQPVPPPPPSQSISQQRARNKRRERSRRHAEEAEEQQRVQIAGEQLSTSDLLGLVDNVGVHSGEGLVEGIVLNGIDVSEISHNGVAKEADPRAGVRHSDAIPSEEVAQEKHSLPQGKSHDRTPSSVIRPGEWVCHSRHGIGRFRGIERTTSRLSQMDQNNGQRAVQEYAVLEYRDGDVYIPFSQFETIRTLTQAEMKSAKLDNISGDMLYAGRGNSAKQRRARHLARVKTRQKIRKQLVNLHGLYAQRTTVRREPFPVDLEAEREFAEKFEFQLTDDQEVATQHVFRDMSETERPMDRLICGDVGFGKTEVALRAAFRALKAGKQVAVLAPTTILAQQHYETFKQRFESAYPQCQVACFTRFVKRKQIMTSKELISRGELQVAVGTHMLLGDSFEFDSLGLLIVDEEHRFGVNQKEKIRARYRGIDTLFLSATPIPRTLHLALSGLRDTSVLRTPPVGRKPVVTRVCPSGSGVIRQAIGKEVERGGQVFFVVPRIEGIEATANWVRDLFPNLKVLVAHGSVTDLEQRFWAFAQREYDVLVCTTIIENGINMPHVNTVIVQDAGRFGLAQLHQLRGRVGRCDVQAYAWMLHKNDNEPASRTALDRLKALEKHSSLGSGFAIAQRDMEMRGVGTILGVEQHGNTSIEADEYAKMLAEELEHARTGKPIPISLPNPVEATEVFLPIASLLPSDYISDFDEKMAAYGSLSRARSRRELKLAMDDLQQRYGTFPAAAKRHVCVLDLKLFAKPLGISRIFTERQHIILDWPVGEAAFKRLVAFLPEEKARSRCELRAADERVVLRGLGICSGDVQLAKLRSYLRFFTKAAAGLTHEKDALDSSKLAQSLSAIANERVQ